MANTFIDINPSLGMGGDSGDGQVEFSTVVEPDEGGAGIQSAIDAAFAAGGGIVQLKAGDYDCPSRISSDIDMNNVWLRGVGPATRLIHSGTYNGEVVLFQSREVQSGAALNNVAIGATSITFTTAADAGNIQENDYLFVDGVATDGSPDAQVLQASADGNGTTGEVTLKTPAIRAATSATGYAYRNGRNNRITDMAFAYTTPAPAVDALAIQMRNQFFGIVENVNTEQSYEDAPSPGNGVKLINFNGYGYKNTCRQCHIDTAFETGIGFGTEIDGLIDNCSITRAATAAAAPAININRSFDCRISNTDVLFSDDVGISVSGVSGNPARRAVIENCEVRECGAACIQALGSNDIRITNCAVEGSVFGIDAFPGFNIVCDNNTIKRCDAALRYRTVENGAMTNNIVADLPASANALLVDADSLNISIVGNTLSNVQSSGIFVLDSRQVTIQGNVIDGVNSGAGIRLSNDADNNLIIGNSSQNSGGVGILLGDDCDNNIVVYNNVNGDGITQGAGTGNDFTGNIL